MKNIVSYEVTRLMKFNEDLASANARLPLKMGLMVKKKQLHNAGNCADRMEMAFKAR